MAPVFFFDVYLGNEILRDDKGVEAANLDEVVSEAKCIMAEMQNNGEFEEVAKAWRMVIHDTSGTLKKVITPDSVDSA